MILISPGAEFTVHSVRKFLSGFGIDHLGLYMRERIAYGFGPQFQRISPGRHCAAWRGFRLTVNADNAAHIHFIRLGGPFHQFGWTSGSGHNTRSHIGEISLTVIFMIEHGDKHGRNAVETGDALLVDAGQGALCGEIGKRTQSRAVGHGGRHGQHHAEAVEHRNLDHHPVRGGQAHAVADAFSVVDNIIMCQHNAFRESGRTGGILHIADVVRFDLLRHLVQRLDGYGIGPFHRFLKGQAALLDITDGDHVPEEGKLFAVERRTGFRFADLRDRAH